MEKQEKLQNDLSDIAAASYQVSAKAESATAAEDKRYFRENELLLRKEELLLLEKLPGAATASALPIQCKATPPKDPTAAYLEDCLKTPAGGRGALCQLLLHGNVEALRQCLATPVTPGLPLPPFAAAKDPRLLQHKLVVPATQQAAPDELAMHVYGAVCDSLTPAGAGCSSGMYTAFLTHRLLERTLWLIAKHRRAAWLEMDRNVAGASGAKVRLQRPDFMVWVKRALLFKGQEKADPRNLRLAVDELTSHTTEAWAAGLMPTVQRPCMLAYAAAGSRIQFFCLKPTPSDNIGGGGSGRGRGSSTSSGSASRWHAHAEPISNVLDLSDWEGRLAAVTATFNIWRLLEDYAESGQPAPEFAIGLSTKFARRHVTFHPGYVCKVIPHYRETHERYVSFELLKRLYERLQSPQHRHAIIKACKPPRLDADGTYVVHLAPLGPPTTRKSWRRRWRACFVAWRRCMQKATCTVTCGGPTSSIFRRTAAGCSLTWSSRGSRAATAAAAPSRCGTGAPGPCRRTRSTGRPATCAWRPSSSCA